MRSITLLTDFGTRDTYVGQMKGVIAAIAPAASVVDLTHDVEPQNVLAGALLLDTAVDAFADGVIHVAVVDPGVGGTRRGIAAQSDRFTLVGPDNGLFTAVWQRYPPREVVTLTNSRYHRDTVSATFHGRDVFAPVAAHLAVGTPLEALGEAIDDPLRLELPEPSPVGDGLALRVMLVDHFGNLVTNLRNADVPPGRVTLSVGGMRIDGIHRTFADVEDGEPVAYPGSAGRLEIALRNDSAAARWGVGPGAVVRLVSRS